MPPQTPQQVETPPPAPVPQYPAVELPKHTAFLPVVSIIVGLLIIAFVGVMAWYWWQMLQTQKIVSTLPAAATSTHVAPSATLGGALYSEVAAQNNPIANAPQTTTAFSGSVNPFDAVYQNPFAQ